MLSADFCHPIDSPLNEPSPLAERQTSPNKTCSLSGLCPSYLRQNLPYRYRTLSLLALSSRFRRLSYASCSSSQPFAYSFLQIPPRDGHPCRSANNSPCRVCRRLSLPSKHAMSGVPKKGGQATASHVLPAIRHYSKPVKSTFVISPLISNVLAAKRYLLDETPIT